MSEVYGIECDECGGEVDVEAEGMRCSKCGKLWPWGDGQWKKN